MDFKKYKRFFAFGCSMTAYGWSTWADIIGNEILEYRNYGQSGAGNLFIACQVTEAHMKYKFNEDDLIMVMWSSTVREDRYVNKHWVTPGNLFYQNVYDSNFVSKMADELGFLIRDINLITLTKKLLETTSADFHFLKMSPFDVKCKDSSEIQKLEQIKLHYKETFDYILEDIYTLECNGKWPQHPIVNPVPGGQTADYHPSPIQHFNYINKLFPNISWSKNTIDFVNKSQTSMEKIKYFSEMNFGRSADRL